MKTGIIILLVLSLFYVIGDCEANCDDFTLLAEEAMTARQDGYMHQFEPSNVYEQSMKVNLFQWPRYRAEDRKARAVYIFSQDWRTACVKGIYGEFK